MPVYAYIYVFILRDIYGFIVLLFLSALLLLLFVSAYCLHEPGKKKIGKIIRIK